MTIGFIGGGNMAGAIIKGLLAASLYRPEEVFVTDITLERSKDCAKRLGVAAADTAEALIEHADTVVLAVKPGVFPSLLPSIAPYLQEKNPLVISIAAGKTLGFIEEVLGFSPALVRVMPNINAKVGAAMSAFCANQQVTQEQKKLVARLFYAIGQVKELDEAFFPLFGVIAGSAPRVCLSLHRFTGPCGGKEWDAETSGFGNCGADGSRQCKADFGGRRASVGAD